MRRPSDPRIRDPRDTPDWSFDVAVAPEAAIQRIEHAINLPKKRLLGLLKTRREFVGVTQGLEFEIWERQERAVHGVGRARGVRGGTRVEMRFLVTPRTRIILVLFFGLYTLGAFGVAAQGVNGLSATSFGIAVAGALALAAIFALGARSQRHQLRVFVEELFADSASGSSDRK